MEFLIAQINRILSSAATLALNHHRALSDFQLKPDGSPISLADLELEKSIRQQLAQSFPQDSIIGEELPPQVGTSNRCWLIDPIDGSTQFILGLPAWSILISCCENQQPVVGAAAFPLLQQQMLATAGHADNIKPQLINQAIPSACYSASDLAQARLATTSPEFFSSDQLAAFNLLAQATAITQYGGDAYLFCLLAGKRIDLVVEAGLKIFDILPLVPIITAAGGKITDWQGNPITLSGNALAKTRQQGYNLSELAIYQQRRLSVVAANSPALHQQALLRLQQYSQQARNRP